MLRRATTRILSHRRHCSTAEALKVTAADDLFMAAWKRTMPNLDPPKTPLSFLQPRPSTASAASIPSKMTINLVSSCSSGLSNKQAHMVIVPATTGQMGILPGHVASISELKPGLLSIYEGNEVTKYFISSGFAFVHSNSVADIIAAEAVPIEQVDPSSVQKGLAEFTQKLSTASTDLEKAEAQIGLDVLSALNSSLSG
ncbi:Mitochondrial F1F0-ATP synthase, subunit delta/ATP16 [Handroanthus impetiginosus]|uniref:Mitochondrial F1F0-ATP synthase, subunit delta/ATP16 n=1 Tax=Handroanthus impetiginosus TaxID=429701 RepID=A0A2G9H628_9LAMI|nr:Mitochondrial F1F0-ATP synthase, subunit delta/ATP16 [Handroanthus impetiginosus]